MTQKFFDGLDMADIYGFTPAEWNACYWGFSDTEDLIDFVHEMHAIDRKVVYDMFRFMPKQMIKEMREAPRLGLEFSEDELETIRKGMDQNEWKKARKDKSDFTKPEPKKEPKKPKDQPKKKP